MFMSKLPLKLGVGCWGGVPRPGWDLRLTCHYLEGNSIEPTFGSLAFGTCESQAAIMDMSPNGSELRASAYASKQRTLVVPGEMLPHLNLGNQ